MFAFFKKLFGKADVNRDGRVDGQDAKATVQAVRAEAKVAGAKTKSAVKKAAVRAKAARNKKD